MCNSLPALLVLLTGSVIYLQKTWTETMASLLIAQRSSSLNAKSAQSETLYLNNDSILCL
ncbi:MAG: hypothetical protein AAF652_05720 [Cyanobacteria bacterium P01_C01_bin.72]